MNKTAWSLLVSPIDHPVILSVVIYATERKHPFEETYVNREAFPAFMGMSIGTDTKLDALVFIVIR
jgi:hypothetical protein